MDKEIIIQQKESDRLEYIYHNYVIPVSETKREVSFEISDGYSQFSNDKQFSTVSAIASLPAYQSSGINNLSVKKFNYQKNVYHYLSVQIPIGTYSLHLSTYQNIQDKYIYTLILSIVIGAAFIIVGLFMLSLGRIITRKALEPLEKIADAVKSISEENLSVTIQPGQNDNEVDFLIIALNNMLNRLNVSFEEQKRFVSDVSHELRIPITIIQGYVEIIQTWGKNDEKIMKESLDAIFTETTNMKNLVEKLLLLQNLGSGYYNFEMENIDVNQLLQKTIFESKMLTHTHSIIHELSTANPMVYADKELLSQAVRSIIENSIKYTNDGGIIMITTSCLMHKVYITISDTGCGIDKEQLKRVKERFYRVDSARTKKTGGSGLGLSIVNASIEAMGGKLIIKSEINVGSQVIISLPRVNP